MKRYYPSIQILRAVLFFFIYAFHAGVPLADFGWGGVEVFFVLSSFFLVKKYYGKRFRINEVFIHRIKRLYPPYVAVVVVATIIIVIMKRTPIDLPFHLLAIQNLYWMRTNYTSSLQPFTAHTWTLVIEIWCGLILLSLLKFITNKQKFKFYLYGCIVLGVTYRIISILAINNIWITSLNPMAHLDSFGLGAILAINARENQITMKKSVLACITGLGFILVVIAYLTVSNQVSVLQGYQLLSSSRNYLTNIFTGNLYLYISILGIGIIGILYSRDERKYVLPKLNKKSFLVYVGDNSYSLYLFHWPVLVIMKRVMGNGILLFAGGFTVSLIATILFDKIMLYFQSNCRKVKV